MLEFRERLTRHAEHIKTAGPHCSTEETTKQALILPLLDALGFSPYDPTKVKGEYFANFPGIKTSDRVDYALFVDGNPVMFIEAKSCTELITNHTSQLARYFNSTPNVSVAAVTNGRQWRFFSDQKHSNIMDVAPFLTVDFEALSESDMDKLARFRYAQFNPSGLRSFAEEQTLLDTFTSTIEVCLRDPDAEFVRFVAGRSEATGRLTPKQIEVYTPIVKQALVDAISKVVVGGLSSPAASPPPALSTTMSPCEETDTIDPDNPKIVTTVIERKILSIVKSMLEGKADESELIGKDTESYYSVCYQGKVNRWILRYHGDKGTPCIIFNISMTPERTKQVERAGLHVQPNGTIVLTKPEHLMKLSNLIMDALEYCQDDTNFKRKASTNSEESEQ